MLKILKVHRFAFYLIVLISDDVWLAKALRRFATCLLVNNNLCGKLTSSSELLIIFDDNLKITSVPLFIADFNLLSCDFDNYCNESFYIRLKIII